MHFFDLADDKSIPDRWYLGAVIEDAGTEPRLSRGIPYEGAHLLAKPHVPGRSLDFTRTAFNVPILSTPLASAISAVAGPAIQLVRVDIPDHPGFFAMNVLSIIHCVDESRSHFVKWTEADNRPDRLGEYHVLNRFTLRRDAIPENAHVFRIGGWTVALVVSEAMRTAMESAGCLGAKFTEIPLS